jgi:acyl-CoA thioester hydrolase
MLMVSRVAPVEGFSFSTDVRIRFAETDAQGIAHHASFVVWLEVARVAYLAAHAGGYQAIRDGGIEALTTEVCVCYHRAVYFDETLKIWTRCTDLRGARFTYEYRIERDGELVADGYSRHATVDRETYRPTRVPARLAEALTRAERRSEK